VGAAAVAPTCADWRDEDLRQIAVAAEQARLQSGRPEVADWEKELDRARLILQGLSSRDANCLNKLSEASRAVFSVSKTTFQDILNDSGLPMDARLDAARVSGDPTTIGLIEKLMTEPLDLKLTAETPVVDRVVDQPIVFALRGLDPNWRTAVDVVVDWGDGSTLLPTDAEKLRQNERLEHPYRAIGTFTPSATASLGGQTIGIGSLKLTVNRSPASLAERLADIFLTTQFGLALLIASVVYYWRFHSGTVTFGAKSVHYVEAFILGFAAMPPSPTCRKRWRSSR
jgi:hypothetical protein